MPNDYEIDTNDKVEDDAVAGCGCGCLVIAVVAFVIVIAFVTLLIFK